MKQNFISTAVQNFAAGRRWLACAVTLAAGVVAAGLLAGCQTQNAQMDANSQMNAMSAQGADTNQLLNLREGDMLRVSFPGSPQLDTTQQIRRDGRIVLPLVGEVAAAGMTPDALQTNLIALYATQLVSKQVTVEVMSSAIPIYVTGMVLRSGKVDATRPMTALEAIMEAGGFDFGRANVRHVKVTRRVGKVMKHYTLNLKGELDGTKAVEPFFMEPGDIIYVPERFNMF